MRNSAARKPVYRDRYRSRYYEPATYRLTFRCPLYRDRYIDLVITNQHTPIIDSIPDRSISTIFSHTRATRVPLAFTGRITIRTRVGSDTIVTIIDIVERRKPIGDPKV